MVELLFKTFFANYRSHDKTESSITDKITIGQTHSISFATKEIFSLFTKYLSMFQSHFVHYFLRKRGHT